MKAHILAATSLLAILVSASPAFAASADQAQPAADNGMGDIVVTARRVEERVQDVPLAVTAVSGAQLAKLGVVGPVELRTVAAGLNISTAAGRTYTAIYTIRGQRSGDQVFTQDPTVAVYQDEVLISPLAGSNTGLFDIAGAEVDKGPQGTLFGRNTTGGAVLFTSAKPTKTLSASVYSGIAKYGSWNAGGYISGPITDQLRARLAVDYKDNHGYGHVLAGPAKGEHTVGGKQFGIRGTVTYEPTSDLTNTASLTYTHYIDRGGSAFQILDTPRPLGPANFVYNNPFNLPNLFPQGTLTAAIAQQKADGPYNTRTASLNGAEVTVWTVVNTTTLKLADNLTLKNIFGYRHLDTWDAADYDGTALNILQATNSARAKTFSEEIQLQGSGLNDRLNFIVGGYYFDQRGIEGTGTPFMDVRNQLPGTIAFDGTARLQFVRITNLSFSGFANAKYKLTDALTLNAGVRYSVDTRRSDSTVGTVSKTVFDNFHPVVTSCAYTDAAGAPLANTFDACRIAGEKSFSNPSWLIGLDWKLDPDTLIYVSSRHSYRSGVFQSRPFDNSTAVLPANPEKITDLEIGFKRDWDLGGDTRLRTNFAAYYQWYRDVQRNSSTLTPVGIGNVTKNAAKAHIYGFELESELRMGRIASLAVNYAYVKPKYDSFPTAFYNSATSSFVPQDRTGYRFQGIATHQLNANLSVTPDVGSAGQLTLLASLYYQSASCLSDDYCNAAQLTTITSGAAVSPDSFYEIKGYALVNLTASLDNIMGSGFSGKVWMKNVFDKRYVDSGVGFADSIGFATGIYGPPRTFGVDVSYKF